MTAGLRCQLTTERSPAAASCSTTVLLKLPLSVRTMSVLWSHRCVHPLSASVSRCIADWARGLRSDARSRPCDRRSSFPSLTSFRSERQKRLRAETGPATLVQSGTIITSKSSRHDALSTTTAPRPDSARCREMLGMAALRQSCESPSGDVIVG